MTYQVSFTETTNPSKPAITVEDQSLNIQTDLTFPGKNYSGYAPIVAENFLHLLENFANNTAPITPVEGQLWYDNSSGVSLLKIFDGTNWTAAGSVKKASTAPLVANSTLGDLWVDTNNQQLYLFSGSTWLLVGPQYSTGSNTGPIIETITDTNNTAHSIITLYANNNRIAIVSKEQFTPKSYINGFTVIHQGINLSSIDVTSTTSPTKFWGIASAADALNINGTTVSSSNFLRTDVTVPSNVQLSIRNDNGINIGSDLSFSISSNTSSTILKSKTNGKSIELNVNDTSTVIHIDSSLKVGINNNNPIEALDVIGNTTISGKIIVTGTQESTAVGIGSIITSGGLSVNKKANFNDDVSVYGNLNLNNLNGSGVPNAGSVLLPGYTTTSPNTPLYDIGSSTQSFRNIYAQQFVGNFTGSFTGALSGNISGSAARLASPTTFNISGDVITTVGLDFDGQTQGGSATFNTIISPDFITSKTAVTDSLLTDTILIYRTGTNAGLKKVTKEAFVSNIPTVPVGAIFPFAGTVIPSGYLLCDGGEVTISEYPQLYSTIGYTYKDFNSLIGAGTFAVPDLRGRFPLGKDNMDNGNTVPQKDNPSILRDAGGGSANRVTDVSADVIGNHAGTESTVLAVTNLPDHKHNMKTNAAQYYAAGIPGGSVDPDAEANKGMPTTSSGYGIRNSGSVDVPVNTTMGQAFSTMNPYLTINYIIFTGVL